MIYFDNAATTYPKPECVYIAVNESQRNYAVNSGRGTYKLQGRLQKLFIAQERPLQNL